MGDQNFKLTMVSNINGVVSDSIIHTIIIFFGGYYTTLQIYYSEEIEEEIDCIYNAVLVVLILAI